MSSAIATASSASLRLASAASIMPRSCDSAANHRRVPNRNGQAMIDASWKAYRITTTSGR
jgi:hypothetical protein